MNNNFNQKFSVIRHWGSPNKATTIWGFDVVREKQLFAPDPYNTFFPCLDYDNHFIYEVPNRPDTVGIPSFMCTCGSAAILIGVEAYKNDASPEGLVFACMFRNSVVNPKTGELWGRHADGSK